MDTRFGFQTFTQQMRTFQAAKENYKEAKTQNSLPTSRNANVISTRTPGGYLIEQKALQEGGEITVTRPNGSKVRIHGDPHISTSRGGGAEVMVATFKEDMTYELDDKTKITVHTVPGPNGQTLVGGATITNGESGFTTSGLTGTYGEIDDAGSGRLRDALTNDGMRLRDSPSGELAGDRGESLDDNYVRANDTGSVWGHIEEMSKIDAGRSPFQY